MSAMVLLVALVLFALGFVTFKIFWLVAAVLVIAWLVNTRSGVKEN